jgi:hypothetical protein
MPAALSCGTLLFFVARELRASIVLRLVSVDAWGVFQSDLERKNYELLIKRLFAVHMAPSYFPRKDVAVRSYAVASASISSWVRNNMPLLWKGDWTDRALVVASYVPDAEAVDVVIECLSIALSLRDSSDTLPKMVWLVLFPTDLADEFYRAAMGVGLCPDGWISHFYDVEDKYLSKKLRGQLFFLDLIH